jgi:hypothetical protein
MGKQEQEQQASILSGNTKYEGGTQDRIRRSTDRTTHWLVSNKCKEGARWWAGGQRHCRSSSSSNLIRWQVSAPAKRTHGEDTSKRSITATASTTTYSPANSQEREPWCDAAARLGCRGVCRGIFHRSQSCLIAFCQAQIIATSAFSFDRSLVLRLVDLYSRIRLKTNKQTYIYSHRALVIQESQALC